ncbi:hypothetical protein [Xanthomonas sp. 3075]|uniref:hypothetical protein n=1 Tax=Xanthomonas sp. 3075 TaxID=3035315 RepID=UPI001607FFEA|nr:hypothetical protein [Xanthomonas sp. 3075]MBB4129266.1 hypothetical protein [Xanthomonas sp. 3075]
MARRIRSIDVAYCSTSIWFDPLHAFTNPHTGDDLQQGMGLSLQGGCVMEHGAGSVGKLSGASQRRG